MKEKKLEEFVFAHVKKGSAPIAGRRFIYPAELYKGTAAPHHFNFRKHAVGMVLRLSNDLAYVSIRPDDHHLEYKGICDYIKANLDKLSVFEDKGGFFFMENETATLLAKNQAE